MKFNTNLFLIYLCGLRRPTLYVRNSSCNLKIWSVIYHNRRRYYICIILLFSFWSSQVHTCPYNWAPIDESEQLWVKVFLKVLLHRVTAWVFEQELIGQSNTLINRPSPHKLELYRESQLVKTTSGRQVFLNENKIK